ncbi:cysteine hydrolase [Bacillus sp. DJP31]|uniref:cysteine hydrolase n=1 Tax=Bacillus sp. DJP31 TaxID=3409789 RepID=UPI003BB5DFD1
MKNHCKLVVCLMLSLFTFLFLSTEGMANDLNLIEKTALVVTDPQNDFLSPTGVAWPLVKDSVDEHNTIENIETLLKTAKEQKVLVFISPHFYYPYDQKWGFTGKIETWMHKHNMYLRMGPLTLGGFKDSGADFLERYKPYIYDNNTVITSPHKVYGPESNDLVLQLRKRNINHVILAGMSANLCVESHMRELIEQGFKVTVVSDATAAAKMGELDGYSAALTNFKMIANDVVTTEEAIEIFTDK